MSFPTSSPSPAWVPSPTSSTASIPVASLPVFEELPSSYEPADSPLPPFEPNSPPIINLDSILDEDFTETVVIDYSVICRQVSRPPVSKALVLYEPHIRNPANLHEDLRRAVTDSVRKEVKELMKQAKEEKGKQQEQKEDVTESTNEYGTLMIQAAKSTPDRHENPKITNTGGALTTKRARTASKEVAHLSNVSFQIPEDFEINSDIVNEFVPAEEVLRETTTRNRKKYSFSDRLRGWEMECRMRLYDGIHQLDKYFTHVQSNITLRSIPEVVSFILYEVNPKQMKEVNRKRKSINLPGSCILQQDPADESRQTMLKDEDVDGDPFEKLYKDMLKDSHEGEKFVEMYLRVAYNNCRFRTSVDVPSEEEWHAWKERKAAKKKAKTTPSRPKQAGTSNVDVEVAISTLMSLAETRHAIQ